MRCFLYSNNQEILFTFDRLYLTLSYFKRIWKIVSKYGTKFIDFNLTKDL